MDIRPVKAGLREYYRKIRLEMSETEKSERDRLILQRLTGLWQYKSCKTLLTYVSKDIEVDTKGLISKALAEGRAVAVPKCVEGTRLEFYYISGFMTLRPALACWSRTFKNASGQQISKTIVHSAGFVL